MKLLNRSLVYLSVVFFIIIGVWSVLFYFNLKDEIRDSIDDGLDNNRILIILNIAKDSTLLSQNEFSGNNFKIQPISKQKALEFTDVFKDTLMYRINENDLEPVRVLHSTFEHENDYYKMTVISSLVEEDDLIEDAFWSVLTLFIILIATIIIINNLVLKRVWNPFYALLNQLKTYRLDKDDELIEVVSNIKEFTQLKEASNTLINRSKEAYFSQKEFTENASHELQTPIAIIINKLELLLESTELQNEEADTIAQVINIANRLKRLNNSLLLLTKIENRQFLKEKEVDINQVVEGYLSTYEDLLAFKQVKVEVENQEKLRVIMDPALAEILIANLLKNAIFHNSEDGYIKIKMTSKELSVCNSGKGTPLNTNTIFNRFIKDPSKPESTGLGLAICKAICESYYTKIAYYFYQNKHCFKVNFKNIRSVD